MLSPPSTFAANSVLEREAVNRCGDLAVPQKLKNSGERSRFCLPIDRFAQALIVGKFCAMLPFNGSEFSLQYPQGFARVHSAIWRRLMIRAASATIKMAGPSWA